MNERAGMNAVELDKYMKNSILPLYPDIEDVPGKRVIIKVDSGPGRLNVEMLADLRLQGLYLVPGVPNTTAKTQETDQNYGVYKTSFRTNLRNLSQCRFENQLSLRVSDLALLVFGGYCPQTGMKLRDAFSDAFSIERNLSCWKKCGAVPLTKAPLFSGEIRHEVPTGAAALAMAGETEDPAVTQLRSLEIWNRYYCDVLTTNGCDGSKLRIDAPKRVTYVAVTEPHSMARVKAIKDAKTAGAMFFTTGGRHLNSDEFFKARALADRETRIKELEVKKKSLNDALLLEDAVMKLLQEKGSLVPQNASRFTVAEVKLLLKWKKAKPTSSKKADLVLAYYSNPPPLTTALWSAEEEMELVALRSENVNMIDTALGVATTQMARAVVQNLGIIDANTRAALKRALDDDSDDLPRGVL
jgi:hypothetical protein